MYGEIPVSTSGTFERFLNEDVEFFLVVYDLVKLAGP